MGRYYLFGDVYGFQLPYMIGFKKQHTLDYLKSQKWLSEYDDDEVDDNNKIKTPWLHTDGIIFLNRDYSITCERYSWGSSYEDLPHTGVETKKVKDFKLSETELPLLHYCNEQCERQNELCHIEFVHEV